MKNLVLGSCLVLSVVSVSGFARSSTVDTLNHNIERCFEQTQLGKLGSKRPCREVLKSGIVNRYNKAIAYHNRGVINLNQGDKDAALRDFKRAKKLHPELALTASYDAMSKNTAP